MRPLYDQYNVSSTIRNTTGSLYRLQLHVPYAALLGVLFFLLYVALLAIQGLFLISIGLIAFFGGFVGVYDVSNGHATPGALVAVLGAFLAWIFLLGGIVSLLCAQGLLTWQRWAIWLTIALEVTNLLVGGCALLLRLFALWPIALSMGVAGGILRPRTRRIGNPTSFPGKGFLLMNAGI